MLQVVSVESVELPTITWRCTRCPSVEFVCSERFRMNTNGKLADIWLIYRCARCEATKNVPVVERRPVSRISLALFDAASTSDPATVRRFARDVSLFRRCGLQVRRGDSFVVSGIATGASSVQLHFAEPLLVRLDDVLSTALGVTRTRLRALDRGGRLILRPTGALSRLRLVETTEVSLSDDAADDARPP